MLGVHDIVKSYLKRHNFSANETINLESYTFMPSIEVKVLENTHPLSIKLGIIKKGKLDL